MNRDSYDAIAAGWNRVRVRLSVAKRARRKEPQLFQLDMTCGSVG